MPWPDQATPWDRAVTSPSGPASFVWAFVRAWYERRFEEARSYVDDEANFSKDDIGDPRAVGIVNVLNGLDWGLHTGGFDVSPQGDEWVTFVKGQGKAVEGGTTVFATYVRFAVRRHGDTWKVREIVSSGLGPARQQAGRL
jgi:hypothetical protein